MQAQQERLIGNTEYLIPLLEEISERSGPVTVTEMEDEPFGPAKYAVEIAWPQGGADTLVLRPDRDLTQSQEAILLHALVLDILETGWDWHTKQLKRVREGSTMVGAVQYDIKHTTTITTKDDVALYEGGHVLVYRAAEQWIARARSRDS